MALSSKSGNDSAIVSDLLTSVKSSHDSGHLIVKGTQLPASRSGYFFRLAGAETEAELDVVVSGTAVLVDAVSLLDEQQRDILERMPSRAIADLISSGLLLRARTTPQDEIDQEHRAYLGPWVGPAEVEKALEVSREAPRKMRDGHRLLGVRFGDRKFYYPARQFESGKLLPGLQSILKALALGAPDPETWATWMAGTVADAPMWELLRTGRRDEVLAYAQADAAQWAA